MHILHRIRCVSFFFLFLFLVHSPSWQQCWAWLRSRLEWQALTTHSKGTWNACFLVGLARSAFNSWLALGQSTVVASASLSHKTDRQIKINFIADSWNHWLLLFEFDLASTQANNFAPLDQHQMNLNHTTTHPSPAAHLSQHTTPPEFFFSCKWTNY